MIKDTSMFMIQYRHNVQLTTAYKVTRLLHSLFFNDQYLNVKYSPSIMVEKTKNVTYRSRNSFSHNNNSHRVGPQNVKIMNYICLRILKTGENYCVGMKHEQYLHGAHAAILFVRYQSRNHLIS